MSNNQFITRDELGDILIELGNKLKNLNTRNQNDGDSAGEPDTSSTERISSQDNDNNLSSSSNVASPATPNPSSTPTSSKKVLLPEDLKKKMKNHSQLRLPKFKDFNTDENIRENFLQFAEHLKSKQQSIFYRVYFGEFIEKSLGYLRGQNRTQSKTKLLAALQTILRKCDGWDKPKLKELFSHDYFQASRDVYELSKTYPKFIDAGISIKVFVDNKENVKKILEDDQQYWKSTN